MVRSRVSTLLLLSSVAAPVTAQPLPTRTGPEPAPAAPAPKPPPDLGPQQPIERALRFYAPPDCVSQERVASTVREWIGRDTLPSAWAVVVKVHQDTAEFSVFEVGRLVALRRFDSLRGGCRDAETVLGASLGLSLEALLQRRMEQPPLAFVLPPTMPPQRPTPPKATPTLTAHATFALGTLLEPAWGGGVVAGLPESDGTWTELGVLTLAASASSVSLGESKLGLIDSRLVGLRLGQCLNNDGERVSTSGCAELLGGAMSAVGSGDMRPLDATLPWAAVALGVSSRLRVVGPLALTASATANLNFVRPSFRVVDDQGAEVEVRQVSELGTMLNVGVTWVYR